MSLSRDIEKLIEEEVERRLNAKLEPLIQYISKEFDISQSMITKCISTIVDVNITTCLGFSKRTHKRCKNSAKQNGFCRIHQEQYKADKEKTDELSVQHTHTLPPFFLKGCPACENRNRFRDSEIEISNE